MINFSLTDEQKALREEIIAFAQEHLNEGLSERDREQRFDRRLWEKCGEIGLPGLLVPKEYGGRGLGAVSTVLALEALGYGCEDGGLNFALSAHLLACLVPICLHGSEEQKKYYLPGLSNGKWIAANAMTEPSAGSDVFNMHSTAKVVEHGYILNGTKSYVSNGPVADIIVTYALTAPDKGFFGGISAFLLDRNIHPYNRTDKIEKLGVRTCMLGEIRFSDLKVDDTALLGKNGAGGMLFSQSMDWERICLGAIHIGAMDRLLKEAVKFAKTRQSAGQAISKYQAVSHPFANLKARLEASRLLIYKAAWKLDEGKNVALDGSIAKLSVSETYRDFALQLNQLYAGAAFREQNSAERALRDSIGGTVYSGTSEILRNIIAKRIGMS